MIVNPEDLSEKEIYKLICGSIVPRPIAWVSSININGIRNLAPFSFFTVAATDPPTLCFSIGPGVSEGKYRVKDTLANIRETKEFVINIVSMPVAEQVHKSGQHFPPEVDEFEEVGVTPVDSHVVGVPSVAEAPIHLECKLDRIIPVGKNHMVLGQLVSYHIQDEYYLGDCKVDISKLQPFGRLARNYSKVKDVFEI